MRSTNWPPKWRAYAHEYSAVRAVPRCRKPVGDGAMRVRTVMKGERGKQRRPSTAQGLAPIGLQIGLVFQADRDANQPFGDAHLHTPFAAELPENRLRDGN